MKGVYQHCAEKHLHRCMSEFNFRYSNRVARDVNDGEHADLAVRGAAGKRLTYRQPHYARLEAGNPAGASETQKVPLRAPSGRPLLDSGVERFPIDICDLGQYC
jgi:hypothetical protein